jgi:hypothetical protein
LPQQPLRDPRSEFSLDPRQREIRELLELIGPEPATYFSDACRIMDGAAGVAAQTHLAAHLLREIEGRLHEVIEPMLSGDATQWVATSGVGTPATGALSLTDMSVNRELFATVPAG